MKTTVERPEKTLRRAKTLAAAKGVSLEQLLVKPSRTKFVTAKSSGRGVPMDETLWSFR